MVFDVAASFVVFATFVIPENAPVVDDSAPLERLPVTVREVSVPTLVIWGWDVFTDNVPEVDVKPVPAVIAKPSTYALVVACAAKVGVPTATVPETTRDESVPTLVIWGWDAFTDNVPELNVRPVPAVRKVSTYAFVAACAGKVGVPTATVPETTSDDSVPTLVICVCDAFTVKLPEFKVKPVPAVRKVNPSTYALVVACAAKVGVPMVVVPETARDESVPTLVIWVWDAFTDNVPDASVRPVPAVRKVSTYAFVAACAAKVGVPMVVVPETTRDDSVPTLVICVWDAFTDKLPDASVRPVPVVMKVKPSTYALVVACAAKVGVPMVTVPETVRDESVPTLVIWVWDSFTDNVPEFNVRPVPAVRKVSTYAFVAACAAKVGVPMVAVPETTRDERVPTLVI